MSGDRIPAEGFRFADGQVIRAWGEPRTVLYREGSVYLGCRCGLPEEHGYYPAPSDAEGMTAGWTRAGAVP